MAAPAFKASIRGMRLDLLLMSLILHRLLRCTKVKYSWFLLNQLYKTRDEGIGVPGRQIDPDAVPAAGGDADRLASLVFHAHQRRDVGARGVHAFQPVADREAVLDDDFHQAASLIEPYSIADIEAAVRFGVAAQVVLVVRIVVALVEAVGVAAVGQAFLFTQQGGVEWLAGDGVVDCLAISLGGTGDVVGALGAALDLQRIDADLDQTVDMLDGAQVFRVQDIGAVLVFLDRHQFARALLFLDQVLDFIFGRFFRLTVRFPVGGAQLVVPATGIGAGALVRLTVVETAGKQTAAGVGDAQRAGHDDFELDI